MVGSFYSTLKWQQTRSKAKKHYGYRCRQCGGVFTGKSQLVVNHIKQVKDLPPNSPLLYDLSNLELLCRPCDNRHQVTDSKGKVVRGSKQQKA